MNGCKQTIRFVRYPSRKGWGKKIVTKTRRAADRAEATRAKKTNYTE